MSGAGVVYVSADSKGHIPALTTEVVDAAAPGLATPVRITGMDLGACHGHPSVADQRMMADRLEAAARLVLP